MLLGVWLAHTATGVFRQSYDTRVFSSIYTDLAARTVSEQATKGVSTSQIVARSSLSREFVNFFERDVPATVNSLFGLLGALVLLFFYDAWSAVFCLMLLVPLAILNRQYSSRTLTLNRRLNNQLEREVTLLTRRRPSRVSRTLPGPRQMAHPPFRCRSDELGGDGTFQYWFVGSGDNPDRVVTPY